MGRASLALAAIGLAVLGGPPAGAAVQSGCFAGRDASGGPARMFLQAERVGDWFEVRGRLVTGAYGVLQFKADGWSGAGRLFRHHEGEAGALYVQVQNLSERGLILQVEGVGRFPFVRVAC